MSMLGGQGEGFPYTIRPRVAVAWEIIHEPDGRPVRVVLTRRRAVQVCRQLNIRWQAFVVASLRNAAQRQGWFDQ